MRDTIIDRLRNDFQDEEARYAYAEDFMNAYIASQIKNLREDRELSQDQLAERVGTQQPGISRFENVNYCSWKVESLRKLARALGVRLRISFEEFGTLIPEIENLKKNLAPRRFEDDPAFKEPAGKEPELQEAFAQAGATTIASEWSLNAIGRYTFGLDPLVDEAFRAEFARVMRTQYERLVPYLAQGPVAGLGVYPGTRPQETQPSGESGGGIFKNVVSIDTGRKTRRQRKKKQSEAREDYEHRTA